MDLIFSAVSVAASFTAQACCWWHCFKWCGCIDREEEQRIHTSHTPHVVDMRPIQNKNPFRNPNAPRDAHLESPYH